jgi:hypothetical protein
MPAAAYTSFMYSYFSSRALLARYDILQCLYNCAIFFLTCSVSESKTVFMVINTLSGTFECPKSDFLLEAKFRAQEEAELDAARSAVTILANPQTVTDVLVGSVVERRELREAVAAHIKVLSSASVFVEETIHNLRAARAEENMAHIADLAEQHFRAARDARFAA